MERSRPRPAAPAQVIIGTAVFAPHGAGIGASHDAASAIDLTAITGPAAAQGWPAVGLAGALVLVVSLGLLLWWRARIARTNRELREGRQLAEQALRESEERLREASRDVTARRQAEEALARRSEDLQSIFDRIPVMLVTWESRLRRFSLNRYAEEVLGWTTQDANAGDFMSLAYPDPDYRAKVVAYMQSLEPGWREWEVTTKDGRTIASDWANIKLADESMIGIGVDLHERRLVEQALRESREDLNRAQAVANVGSWRLDVRHNVLLWSDENYRIFDRPVGSRQSYDTFLECVHPDDRRYVDRAWTAALQGTPYDIEHRIITRAGEKWVRERAELEFDAEGTLLGGFGTTQDVTERKQAEEVLRALAAELDVERGKLAAAIDRADVGLVFTDEAGTFLSMNTKALELHRFASGESMFAQFERYVQDFELRYPDGSTMEVEDWPLSRALRGEFVRDYEARVRRRDGSDEWIGSYSAAPVTGPDGETILIVFSIFDLTVRRHLEDALLAELETSSVLLEAASALSEWTDSTETLGNVVQLVATVSGHSRVGLHVWHATDRELEVVAATGAEMPPLGTRTPVARLSSTTRRALVARRTAVVDFRALSPAQRGMAEEAGALLSLSVPIVHRGELVGLLAIDEPGRHLAFTGRQIELVEGIAAQAAVAIENAGLYEAQRRIATVLQEQFIHPLPRIDGLEVAVVAETAFEPELVGGDFHDVFELPNGLVAILLGDVEGKGVGAAALSETVRSAVRALAIISQSPRYVLNNVNRMLLQQHSTQFVTALLTILDPSDGLALMASAGHPAGILVRDGSASSIAMRFGVPLGALLWDHEQTRLRLQPGDRLVMYTDGASEARHDGEQFGEEGIVETLRSVVAEHPQAQAQAVRDAATAFADRLHDDLRIVALRFTGRTPPPDAESRRSHLSLIVPDAPWRLIDTRGAVRDFLSAHAVDGDALDDLVMCVEEACTNALRHSGSREPTEVRLTVDHAAIDISIRDHGCGFDADGLDLTRMPDPLATSGRGLYLIRAVVDEMEVINREGTRVHVRRYRGTEV